MRPSIPLVGDAKHIFQDFQKEEFDCNYEEWLTTLNEYRSTMEKKRTPNPDYVDPAAFITRLSEKMQEDGVYVADVGQNQIWSCGYHIVKKGKFLTSGGMGTMGYSIPQPWEPRQRPWISRLLRYAVTVPFRCP